MFCPSVLLVAHLMSVHAHAGANDQNLGAGVECRGSRYSTAVGTYENSYSRQSVYGVFGVRALRFAQLGLRVDGVLGAATGYDEVRDNPFIAGLRVSWRQGRTEMGALLVPPTKETGAFAHFTVSFSL